MNLDRAFLFFNIILILVSVVAHEVASGSFAFLVLTAGVCGLVWHLHRQGRPPQLGDTVATLICGAAFALMIFRGLASSSLHGVRLLDVRVPAVGQFLIVFQWVSLLREKKPRDYAWVYLVTVVHMGTAGLLMPGVAYAIFFLLYAAAAVCALSVSNLCLEMREARGEWARGRARIGAGFLLSGATATLALTLPVAAIFMALPRRPGLLRLTPQLVRLSVQPVAGFSGSVRLGEIGRIQENPQRVMHVTMRDPETGETRRADGLLLKGIALDTYEQTDRGWSWVAAQQEVDWERRAMRGGSDVTPIYDTSFPGFRMPGYERIQCDISLEPLQTPLLFAPFAAEAVLIPRGRELWAHPWMHAFYYWPRRRQPIQYSVVSRLFAPRAPSGDRPDRAPDEAMLSTYLQLSQALSPRIAALAHQIAAEADCPDDYSKAMRILTYLSDEQRFTYTLTMSPTPGVEPVEDFLYNRKRGHCEYFASAMALLLREVGVPARVVNGFRVTEWNPIGGHYVVRQANAHSWVEAYLRPDGWRTFDPSVTRDAATPGPVFVTRWGRNLYDAAETLWVRHVLNYDTEAQTKVFGLVGAFVESMERLWTRAIFYTGAEVLGMDRRQMHRLARQAKPLLQVVLILAASLLVLAALRVALPRLWRRLRARRGPGGALQFYQRMEQLLTRHGFRRQPSQTPWEFRDALAGGNWPAMGAVEAITRDFCAARYGGRALSAEEKQEIAQALLLIRRTSGAAAPLPKRSAQSSSRS